jgi:hypothetical protein
MKTKGLGWGEVHGSNGRAPECPARTGPWVQSPVPQKREKKKEEEEEEDLELLAL